MNRTVFVGDLSYFCNEVQLMQYFSAVGKVLSVEIKRGSTGESLLHGFIKFEADAGALAAVNHLHGVKFLGRKLIVNSTNSKAPKKTYDRWHKLTIHFTSESTVDVTEEFLDTLCTTFGEVSDAVVRSHVPMTAPEVGVAGYAVVFFSVANAATRACEALHGRTVQNVTFNCSISTHTAVGGPAPTTHPRSRTTSVNSAEIPPLSMPTSVNVVPKPMFVGNVLSDSNSPSYGSPSMRDDRSQQMTQQQYLQRVFPTSFSPRPELVQQKPAYAYHTAFIEPQASSINEAHEYDYLFERGSNSRGYEGRIGGGSITQMLPPFPQQSSNKVSSSGRAFTLSSNNATQDTVFRGPSHSMKLNSSDLNHLYGANGPRGISQQTQPQSQHFLPRGGRPPSTFPARQSNAAPHSHFGGEEYKLSSTNSDNDSVAFKFLSSGRNANYLPVHLQGKPPSSTMNAQPGSSMHYQYHLQQSHPPSHSRDISPPLPPSLTSSSTTMTQSPRSMMSLFHNGATDSLRGSLTSSTSNSLSPSMSLLANNTHTNNAKSNSVNNTNNSEDLLHSLGGGLLNMHLEYNALTSGLGMGHHLQQQQQHSSSPLWLESLNNHGSNSNTSTSNNTSVLSTNNANNNSSLYHSPPLNNSNLNVYESIDFGRPTIF